MIKTIFVLGAGASKIAGAPLMRDFLDRAKEILLTGKVEDVKASFERVFRAIGSLQSVHSKSDLDIVNVESVFACLEMANILEKLPGHEPEEITALLKDMKFVISRNY